MTKEEKHPLMVTDFEEELFRQAIDFHARVLINMWENQMAEGKVSKERKALYGRVIEMLKDKVGIR